MKLCWKGFSTMIVQQTHLMIKTSWENSFTISIFKFSGLRTFIATSWLQYVPLYLKKTQYKSTDSTNSSGNQDMDCWLIQISKWPRCYFIFKFQQADINFPVIRSISRYFYTIGAWFRCLTWFTDWRQDLWLLLKNITRRQSTETICSIW